MKAIQKNSYGGPEVLEKNDIPLPTPQKGQLLIEIYAAGLNPFDSKLRMGLYKEMMPLTFPVTVGGDYAGVVKEVGEGVTDFKIGDEVYGTAIVLNGGSGAYAEFAVANAANTSLKPKQVSFEEAAALPVAGNSVVQVLEEHMKLPSYAKATEGKQKVLIHGGAGGIGHMAIQLAKSIGAYIATTVNGDDIDYAKNLGADEVIDYNAQHFETILKDYDGVFDTVGGETTNKSFQVLKRGGVLVSMLGQPSQELAGQYGVTAIGQNTQNTKEHLTRLAELVNQGKIKVHLDKVFSLEQVRDAFTHLETGHPRGKVVLKIK